MDGAVHRRSLMQFIMQLVAELPEGSGGPPQRQRFYELHNVTLLEHTGRSARCLRARASTRPRDAILRGRSARRNISGVRRRRGAHCHRDDPQAAAERNPR